MTLLAYAVSGVKGKLIAVNLNGPLAGDAVVSLSGTEYDLKSMLSVGGFTYGDMTSVAVSPDGSKLAVAIQAEGYADAGIAALFSCGTDGALELLATASVGAQPDMVTFADNRTILTADEGEPRLGTSGADPKGSVTIVTIDGNNALMANTVTFDSFNEKRDALAAAGVLTFVVSMITSLLISGVILSTIVRNMAFYINGLVNPDDKAFWIDILLKIVSIIVLLVVKNNMEKDLV